MVDLLHGLALFLLCLVGYSAGVVGGAGRPIPRPAGWELVLSALAGLAAAATAPGLAGPWLAFPLAVGYGGVPGACAGLLRRGGGAAGERPAEGATPLLGGAKASPDPEAGKIRAFLLRLGEFQGRVTMGYLYFLLLAPFAVVARLKDDPLAPASSGEGHWSPRAGEPPADGDEPLTRQY